MAARPRNPAGKRGMGKSGQIAAAIRSHELGILYGHRRKFNRRTGMRRPGSGTATKTPFPRSRSPALMETGPCGDRPQRVPRPPHTFGQDGRRDTEHQPGLGAAGSPMGGGTLHLHFINKSRNAVCQARGERTRSINAAIGRVRVSAGSAPGGSSFQCTRR
jgi:hypothetical protein